MPTELTAIFPIKTVSEANQREHWAKKHRRSKSQKEAAYYYCLQHFIRLKPAEGARILLEITRLANRKLDKDNLYGSGKAVVDGICKWLDVDDGSRNFTLVVSQEFKSKSNELRVKLTFTD